MISRLIPLLVFLITLTSSNAQKDTEFGELTSLEKNFEVYEKDTTANAVVLYEKGENYFEFIKGRLKLVKTYHGKIKILKKEGVNEAVISIPYYHSKNGFERVESLKALTHNGPTQIYLNEDQIFTVDTNENWSEKRFTFPDVQPGSVLEYTYKLVTPFTYNLNGWNFQTHIPKIYSEFHAKIPGNYIYNRSLIGSLKLDVNNASELEHCIYVKSISKYMSCEVLNYTMKDIPAFKEEEEYMLAASNYISRLEFELSEIYFLDGSKEVFTRSWKDVDREFKTDPDIGRQLGKKSFYEDHVKPALFMEENDLQRAKDIYRFTQERFSWTGEYGIYKDIDVKEAYEKKAGNIGEINITLINLLNMAGLKTNLVLLSTRNHGMPKQSHPVITDFNYIIAKVEIGGKTYLLDASDKTLPFGILPYRCLNYSARVMDFKEDSYWYDIKAYSRNKRTARIDMYLDADELKLFGTLEDISLGYDAIRKRRVARSMSDEEYLGQLETIYGSEMIISDHEMADDKNEGKKVTEKFKFEIDLYDQENSIFIDPFIVKHFRENPFKLEERNYPIDFGYNRNYVYYLRISVPDGYSIKELPKPRTITSPNNSVGMKFDCTADHGIVNLYFNLFLKSPHYTSNDYPQLKSLLGEVTNIQNKSLIVLEKNSN